MEKSKDDTEIRFSFRPGEGLRSDGPVEIVMENGKGKGRRRVHKVRAASGVQVTKIKRGGKAGKEGLTPAPPQA